MTETAGAHPPCVSVIIPTYNRAPLLQCALDSVLCQSYRDWEVLVCDDGSADETAASLGSAVFPVRYLRLDHTGSLGRTRNSGIQNSRGEFIAFLDDDDFWHPFKLERQVAALQADPAAGVAYTDAQLLLPDGSLSPPVLSSKEKRPGRLFSRLLQNCFFHPSTVMVRRDLLIAAGAFDESLYTGEDLDLWLRLASMTREVCVPEPLVTIRRHAFSHSTGSGLQAFENAIEVIERQRREGRLSFRERVGCRAAIARLHARASVAALESHDAAAARFHSRRALEINPLQRRAWSVLRLSHSMKLRV